MSTTPRPPLLSDDEALTMARKEGSNWRLVNQSDAVDGAEETILAVRKIYEAERAKDAELIQRLVDELADRMQPNLDERFRGEQWHQSKRILDVAAAAGFKPTEP